MAEEIGTQLGRSEPTDGVTAPSPNGHPGRRRTSLRPLLRTARPRQWVKNVLVAAAPGAAGVLTHGSALWRTAVAFVAFTLAASGTYFLNDSFDVEADRRHPTKRRRPIAAGEVPVRTAQVVGGFLIAAAIGVGFAATWRLSVVIAVYVALTTSYSIWLKHQAVIDLGAVAAGFVLRMIGGAVAVHVPISNWFLIVASFGSLFVVADIKAGETITEKNVRSIRPARGLHPRHLPEVLGRKATRELFRGTPLKKDMISIPPTAAAKTRDIG